MKRTFKAQEKEFIFDTWKMGIGFSDIAKKANLNETAKRNISGHSARVGHAHDLLKEGKSLPQIMVAGGWKSTDIVLRYIENSNLVLHS